MEFFTITLALISLGINFYQAHRENRARAKMESWLEFARGIHAVSEQKGTTEMSRITNSLVADLDKELDQGRFWRIFSFCLFLFAAGLLIGSLIPK